MKHSREPPATVRGPFQCNLIVRVRQIQINTYGGAVVLRRKDSEMSTSATKIKETFNLDSQAVFIAKSYGEFGFWILIRPVEYIITWFVIFEKSRSFCQDF